METAQEDLQKRTREVSAIRIGVLDTDGAFTDGYFAGKKWNKPGQRIREEDGKEAGFSHAEYVCSHIFKENPDAEILLLPILGPNMKCTVMELIRGIGMLIDRKVDIIHISAGDEHTYHPELEHICRKAYDEGILMVAAHSNRDVEATYPASFPFVIGVRSVDEKEPGTIVQIDMNKRDIIFSSGYFSIYHLGIPKLHHGNSFACAMVTGLLSHGEAGDYGLVNALQKSPLNRYYPYQDLKTKKCYFLSNRPEEFLQQKFAAQVTNAAAYEKFRPEILERWNNGTEIEGYDTVFIDHDCYSNLFPYKNMLLDCMKNNLQKEWVFRHPLFNVSERMNFYINHGIVISQFFL